MTKEMSSGNPTSRGAPSIAGLGSTALLLIGLTYPLAIVWNKHWTLTGACEESVGYRYFYSLRQVYERGSYVFLPQGQLMDICHQILQVALTGFGYPPTTLFPRIDIFTYVSIGLAHLLAAAAFYFLVRTFTSAWERILLVPIVLVPYFNPSVSGYNAILIPDYMAWILPCMFLALGIVLPRLPASKQTTGLSDLWALALLTSASLGLKMTLGIYPLTLAVILLFKGPKFSRSLVIVVFGCILGILGWLSVLLVYYHGKLSHVARFFRDESTFGSGSLPSVSYLHGLESAFQSASWLLRLSLGLPLLVLLSVPFLHGTRTRLMALGIFAGATVYQILLLLRFTPATWFEAAVYTIFAVIVLGCLLKERIPPIWRRGAFVLGALLASVQFYVGSVFLFQGDFPNLGTVNRAQSMAQQALAKYDDRIAFLLPDNSYRPLTVDSAIFKGGSNILEGPVFGKSAILKKLFPRRAYFASPGSPDPIDIAPFSAVVFTIRKGMDPDPYGQLAIMKRFFGKNLSNLSHFYSVDFGSQEFLIWPTAPLQDQAPMAVTPERAD